MAKRTAKQRVQRRYPSAVQWNQHEGEWRIYNGYTFLGRGKTAKQAWAAADRRTRALSRSES